MRRLAPFLWVMVLAAPVQAQGPPPDGDWVTFDTEHFRVTHPPDLEGVARHAARVAEETYAVLSHDLAAPPEETIDLLVSDHVDYSNGYASAIPSPRIVVYARPASGAPEFYAPDWMELVVAHELVHIFHLERTGAVGSALRDVFGRAPFFWPFFPVSSTPAWSVEGLAVYYESRLTGAGRVRSALHDMIIRTAALESEIPELDELSAPNPVWPGGDRSYIYGGRLMAYVAQTYGPEAHRQIVDATAGSILPTFILFGHVSNGATGKRFDALWDEWRGQARAQAEATARRVRREGITETRPVAGRGPFALTPRVSPDGTLLSYGALDYRSAPATRLVSLGRGDARTLARRNQVDQVLGPAPWLPDASGLVVAQLEFQGPYRVYSDLWRLDLEGRETRLTRGARLSQPDVAADGRIAAIQAHEGGLRLVTWTPEEGVVVVADAAPGEAFDRPRWSPDSRSIAAARYAGGQVDLVLVDVASGRIRAVTDDDALDRGPTWSPDGRWLVWGADRSGVPNIHAVPVEEGRPTGPVRRITNVLTGAVDPEVSPDGATLYMAVYHHDGWRIESMPFAPEDRPVSPHPAPRSVTGLLAASSSPEDSGAPATGGPTRAYAPEATLGPRYWVPVLETREVGPGRMWFLGARTGGRDLLERHEWEATAAVDVRTGRLGASGSWGYRGLGNPTLAVTAERRWSYAGFLELPDGGQESFLNRDDQMAVSATYRLRRWRRRVSFQLGAEVERTRIEGWSLTDSDLRNLGVRIDQPPLRTGVVAGAGYSSLNRYAYSISSQDGLEAGVSAGRWWRTDPGGVAYDEVAVRGGVYQGVGLWGYADHVLVLRGRGTLRTGPFPRLVSAGGPPGGLAYRLVGSDPVSNPIRGFAPGTRVGTRLWTATAEWRIPLALRHAPKPRAVGVSVVSLSGALFADAGNAWCTPAEEARDDLGICAARAGATLASAGAELTLNLGIYHNTAARLVAGAARPIRGPGGARAYVAFGF